MSYPSATFPASYRIQFQFLNSLTVWQCIRSWWTVFAKINGVLAWQDRHLMTSVAPTKRETQVCYLRLSTVERREGQRREGWMRTASQTSPYQGSRNRSLADEIINEFKLFLDPPNKKREKKNLGELELFWNHHHELFANPSCHKKKRHKVPGLRFWVEKAHPGLWWHLMWWYKLKKNGLFTTTSVVDTGIMLT